MTKAYRSPVFDGEQIELTGVTPAQVRSAGITVIETLYAKDPEFAVQVLDMLGIRSTLRELDGAGHDPNQLLSSGSVREARKRPLSD